MISQRNSSKSSKIWYLDDYIHCFRAFQKKKAFQIGFIFEASITSFQNMTNIAQLSLKDMDIKNSKSNIRIGIQKHIWKNYAGHLVSPHQPSYWQCRACLGFSPSLSLHTSFLLSPSLTFFSLKINKHFQKLCNPTA